MLQAQILAPEINTCLLYFILERGYASIAITFLASNGGLLLKDFAGFKASLILNALNWQTHNTHKHAHKHALSLTYTRLAIALYVHLTWLLVLWATAVAPSSNLFNGMVFEWCRAMVRTEYETYGTNLDTIIQVISNSLCNQNNND